MIIIHAGERVHAATQNNIHVGHTVIIFFSMKEFSSVVSSAYIPSRGIVAKNRRVPRKIVPAARQIPSPTVRPTFTTVSILGRQLCDY